jgi:mannose-6-phosphate isomerase-like protein (cupin superfamily)
VQGTANPAALVVEIKTNKTKSFELSPGLWYTNSQVTGPGHNAGNMIGILLSLLLLGCSLHAQDRPVDPTWLHRYLPELSEATGSFTSASCHYKPIFGNRDPDQRILRTVTRFALVTLDANGSCPSSNYDREEEIYFILEGGGSLLYAAQSYPMRQHDFTYLPPGVKHSIANGSPKPMQVLVMAFKIEPTTPLDKAPAEPKIANLDELKEETVEGHPTSVLYKLLIGPRTGKRDAIDQAYVVTSLFWMNFAPGGTNFPHHHETAEEIYLVLEGQGEMVAGGGMDGVEGRFPAKAGDAYYFRPNCTVGFYNQNKPGAKAYILAVRSRIPLEKPD